MSILNSKYTTHLEILNRLGRVITQKEINPTSVLEWCQQVETEIIMDVDSFYRVYQHSVDVHEVGGIKMSTIPVNVYKLIDVYKEANSRHSRVEFNNTGTHIHFIGEVGSQVFIDYLGMPFSEEEPHYPMILKGHELACEAYCKAQMFEEDYLMGRIDGQRYSFLQQEKHNQILAAIADSERHKTKIDNDRIQIIRSNLIPFRTSRPLEKGMYGAS